MVMLSKELQKYIAYPKFKKGPRKTFFELAKKHIVKSKGKFRNASQNIDRILYGK